MKIETINGLETAIVGDKNAKQAFIICHGYGANMHDLAPLAQFIKTSLPTCFFFPNAPIKLAMSPYFDSRAWFPIDMAALEKAMQSGGFRDFTGHASEEFYQALAVLGRYLEPFFESYESVIIGGFSQGAMLSSHLMMNYQNKLAAAVILSGVLIDEEKFSSYQATVSDFAVYQSHGTNDPVLEYNASLALRDKLLNFKCDHHFTSFNGAHEIPQQVLVELNQFLSKKGL